MCQSDLTFAVTLTLNWIEGQIWNSLYLSQNGPIATKRKANILFVLWALNVIMKFDLGYDLDTKFSWSNMKFAMEFAIS